MTQKETLALRNRVGFRVQAVNNTLTGFSIDGVRVECSIHRGLYAYRERYLNLTAVALTYCFRQ